jgi:hypothetical protein
VCPELVEGQCVARVCAPSLSKGTEMSLVPAPGFGSVPPSQQTPLVDHQLIAHADAADLPREYCSATMTQFLVPVLQLPHGEPAAALGPAPACSANT